MIFFILALLILIDALLYGFGAAIQNLNHSNLEKKCEEGNQKAILLSKITEAPEVFVNTLQLVTSIIGLVIGVCYIRMLAQWIRQRVNNGLDFLIPLSFLAATVGLLFLLLTVGILVPKKLGIRFPEQWAYFLVKPIHFMTRVLYPFTMLITLTTNLIVRLLGVDPESIGEDVTEEEIISMVNEGHEQGVLEANEAEMITNIFEFGDKEARDIMTHRENIIAIDSTTTLDEALNFMLEGKNSRYPVYEENIDNIIGILHFKDAVKSHTYQKNRNKPVSEVEDLVKQAVFIPETRNINDLFGSMQQNKIHMMIVVDEYGQTAGLVAMEDILEEIVGNILDEYDEEENHIKEQEDDTYVMDGLTKLNEVEEQLDIEFDEEFETLNGFMTNSLGRIPEEGDDFETEYKGYRFKILEVENKVIQSVKCTRMAEEEINIKNEP